MLNGLRIFKWGFGASPFWSSLQIDVDFVEEIRIEPRNDYYITEGMSAQHSFSLEPEAFIIMIRPRNS